ncbi:MAG: cytochrome P450 [Thermoactinomyces sp.]
MAVAKKVKYANLVPMKEFGSMDAYLNPFPVLNRLREEIAIRYDEARECWDVFRYEDVHHILKDPRTFSSQRGGEMLRKNLLTMDPPQHTQMRNLVSKAFTPKAIQALESHIREISESLLDDVIGRGEMDMVHDFATPLPVIVIAELLGVSPNDRALFKLWSDLLVKSPEDSSDEAFAKVLGERRQAGQELDAYFLNMMEQRRKEPREDLISALLAAEIDGRKLTDEELTAFARLLLVAGNETTTNLITNAVYRLTEDLALQETLWQNPSMIPSFVEEVLRYYPPIKAIGRIAARDVEIAGQRIQTGEQVVAWVASANRDHRKFADPDTFDPKRKPNPHLSFGFGIHFCLGAPLARLEAKVALEVMSNRLKEMRLKQGVQQEPIQSTFVYGFKHLPITFKA